MICVRDAELQRMMPDWVPFAPNKWWIHVRTVGESAQGSVSASRCADRRSTALPMAFMYSTRFVGPYTPLIFALRQVRCNPIHIR